MSEAPSTASGASALRIDAMMERASAALAAMSYFEALSLSVRALRVARQAQDFERMARICLPLQESRRLIRQLALDAGAVYVVRRDEDLPSPLAPGCYLIEPPLIGADGLTLREVLERGGVPAIVLTREPLTKSGQWPLAAVRGEPPAVRAKMSPPVAVEADASSPSRDRWSGAIEPVWFERAGEALGDAAIAMVGSSEPAQHRVDDLLEMLEAVPDHEKLHQRLAEACREALQEPAPTEPRRRPLVRDPWGF